MLYIHIFFAQIKTFCRFETRSSNRCQVLTHDNENKIIFHWCGKDLSQVSKHVTVLKRMEKTVLFKICLKLYQAFIVPCLNSCAETWHFCSKHASDKQEKNNEKTLRIVYLDNSSSYKMLLKRCSQQTLSKQRLVLAMILNTVYKIVNKQNVLKSICDLLNEEKIVIIYKEMQFWHCRK